MGRFIAAVSLALVCACGGYSSGASEDRGAAPDAGVLAPALPRNGSNPPAADAGTEVPDAAGASSPDAGSADGSAADAGPPTFSLRLVVQGQGVVTSEPPGIDCGQRCQGEFVADARITLSAKAAAGWSVSGFGGRCPGDTCIIQKWPSSQTVEVVFTQDPPPPGVSTYTIAALPPVVGQAGDLFTSLNPTGINSSGQVAGAFVDCVSVALSECSYHPSSAFLYDPTQGTTVWIAHPDAANHSAVGIGDTGAILLNGGLDVFDGLVLANGIATHFGLDARVLGINSQGWVSGTNTGSDGLSHAFLWDGTTERPIGPARSSGAGVNAAGVVAGAVANRAAVFGDGAPVDLGIMPGDAWATGIAISDRGRVVGVSVDDVWITHAFVFDLPDGPMRDVVPHGSSSLSSVNVAGDAVGSVIHSYSPVRAILWHDGTVVDLTRALNDPSWTLLSATGINDRGQICGVGVHDGVWHGYVLTPR